MLVLFILCHLINDIVNDRFWPKADIPNLFSIFRTVIDRTPSSYK
jgi:hypothetical protein